MKVLVLGASGFLGSWATRALAGVASEVTCLVRPTTDVWRIASIRDVQISRSEPDRWPAAITSLEPDIILSCDWSGVSGANRDDSAQWANLSRVEQVLGAARRAGVRRFVGVGSQAEYGPVSGVISEDMVTAPVTEYGKAKLAAMSLTREMAEAAGMEWAWARVFSTFGPLDNDSWLLPTVADALLAGRRIALSSGEQRWSYLPGWDAGRALAVLALTSGVGGIYNIGHPKAPRLRDVIEQFAEPLGNYGLLGFGDIELTPTSVRHLEPDVSRIEAAGWRAESDISEALSDGAKWFSGLRTKDWIMGGLLPSRPRRRDETAPKIEA